MLNITPKVHEIKVREETLKDGSFSELKITITKDDQSITLTSDDFKYLNVYAEALRRTELREYNRRSLTKGDIHAVSA